MKLAIERKTHSLRFERTCEQLKCLRWNVETEIANIFIHRDNKIVIFGAWGGEKFADNSRYLFQYLNDNKKRLGLKRVIWITSNKKVNNNLRRLNYESYLFGTKESKYYHLRSGVHIICNSFSYNTLLKPDIETRFSWGAKKIQLWHGVGMKAVGTASNTRQQNLNEQRLCWKRKHPKLFGLLQYGGWNDAYFLSTSVKNADVNFRISESPRNHMFISSYPRNCKCLKLLPEEIDVVNKIKLFKGAILFLPTFRDDNSTYIHPLEYTEICQMIKQNNWVWIEKPHSADTAIDKFKRRDCSIIELDSNFDINVLYPYISGLVSDYSSAVFDGAYKNIPTIMYTPDLEEFKNGPIGFLFNIERYCEPLICKGKDKLIVAIREIIDNDYLNDRRKKVFNNIRKDFWDNRESHYDQIWKDILNVIES